MKKQLFLIVALLSNVGARAEDTYTFVMNIAYAPTCAAEVQERYDGMCRDLVHYCYETENVKGSDKMCLEKAVKIIQDVCEHAAYNTDVGLKIECLHESFEVPEHTTGIAVTYKVSDESKHKEEIAALFKELSNPSLEVVANCAPNLLAMQEMNRFRILYVYVD